MKSKVALAVAIALAILTAVGIRAFLRQKDRERAGEVRLVKILVAAKTLKKGHVLVSDDLKVEEVDQRTVRDERTLLSNQRESLLRRAQPLMRDVRANEPLLWSHFTESLPAANPAAGLAYGYRHITVPVDKVTGCAGRLVPGTNVDVIATIRVSPTPNAPAQAQTRTVLTGVEVVATDLRVRRVQDFLSPKERRDYAAYSTVTLRVLPGHANLLAFLTEQAKLHLLIRSPDDDSRQGTAEADTITMAELNKHIAAAAAEKPAEPVPAEKETEEPE